MENLVRDFVLSFLAIVYEAMPFLILGSLISGTMEEMVPQRTVTRLIPRRRTLAIVISALLGVVFPMCECGIVPIMRRLLLKGLPLSCGIAYMLAGPIVNVVVLLATAVAFLPFGPTGVVIIVLRMVLGFLVAFGTAMLVQRQEQRHGVKALVRPESLPPDEFLKPNADGSPVEVPDWEPHAGGNLGFSRRLGNILAIAMVDFIDIFTFLILGALVATLLRLWLTNEVISELTADYPLVSIAAMMGLAVVICLCSEADAFVAASFSTMVPAAKLAFLVVGPMLDFKLFLMYLGVFRARLIRTLVLGILAQVFLYCVIVFYLWPLLPLGTAGR